MSSEPQKSILVIDDDQTIRKLISFNLGKIGYNIQEARSAVEGFNHLNTSKIDLVLCDVKMDDMDGFAFCKQVRSHQNYRALPFIFVTGQDSLEDKNKALEAGGDDFISKPFNVDELIIKVKSLVRRSEIYRTYGVKQNLQKNFSSEAATILLVDDDISVAKLYQFNLKKADFNCQIASNVEDGFKLAKELHPDLIISDVIMPDIGGFEFRKMILNDQELNSIPFIFLTSKEDEKDILDGYELGVNDYMIKNTGPNILTAKVRALIKSSRNEKERLVSELNDAADSLKVKVIPDSKPSFGEYYIDFWHQSFKGIPGGDFIDFLQLDKDNLAVILGDVMGKKWGAWYFAFAYAGYIRSAVRLALKSAEDYSPSRILQYVNRSVYEDSKISEVFATLSIVIINSTGILKYSGAGDLPIFIKRNSEDRVVELGSKGLLLGFAMDGEYEDNIIKLKENDFVYLLTDGMIESRNKNGEQFGKSNFETLIQNIGPEDDSLARIRDKIKNFTDNNYEDDVSIISIKKIREELTLK
jgi:sigma-B regulation protein RsbU (phosphoserine phosphatase)